MRSSDIAPAIKPAPPVPALDPKRPPHPLEIADGDAGAEILEIEAAPQCLGAARRVRGPTLGHGIVGRVHGDGDGRVEERVVEVRAEFRLRSAGSPLIDQYEIAAGRIRHARLLVRVDSEGTAWAAADVNNGIRQRGLLRASDDDDRQLKAAAAGVVVVPWDPDGATAQARTDLRRNTRKIADRLVENRLERLRLAARMSHQGISDHEHEDTAGADIPQRGLGAEASPSGEPCAVARQEAPERPAQGGPIVRDIVKLVPHRLAPWAGTR